MWHFFKEFVIRINGKNWQGNRRQKERITWILSSNEQPKKHRIFFLSRQWSRDTSNFQPHKPHQWSHTEIKYWRNRKCSRNLNLSYKPSSKYVTTISPMRNKARFYLLSYKISKSWPVNNKTTLQISLHQFWTLFKRAKRR
jgi:hypothetical protein